MYIHPLMEPNAPQRLVFLGLVVAESALSPYRLGVLGR